MPRIEWQEDDIIYPQLGRESLLQMLDGSMGSKTGHPPTPPADLEVWKNGFRGYKRLHEGMAQESVAQKRGRHILLVERGLQGVKYHMLGECEKEKSAQESTYQIIGHSLLPIHTKQ